MARGTRTLLTALLGLGLLAGGGSGAWAFDWPRDPGKRPVPETEVSTVEAEARIAADLSTVLERGGLGGSFSLQVVDVESGRVIADRRGSKARRAASNTKLFTAVAALDVLGKNARFSTTVTRRGGSKNVTLVGGGDMRITNTKLRSLATQTAKALRAKPPARTKGKRLVRVQLDDSRYQGAATKLGSWRQGGYNLRTIQPVRSIVRAKSDHKDAAASAARYLTKKLDAALPKSWQVRFVGRKSSPAKARTVARVESLTVGSLVKRMLLVSDNQLAEGLHREIALAAGHRPTFSAGARVAKDVAKGYGVDVAGVRLADGSGLSPRNILTPRALTGLLGAIADPDNEALRPILFGSGYLPVAGQRGTLARSVYGRFVHPESECAVGLVVGKTGSLDWERALSGLTVGADGRLKAFSVLVNSLRSTEDRRTAVRTLDHVAALVNGCAGADVARGSTTQQLPMLPELAPREEHQAVLRRVEGLAERVEGPRAGFLRDHVRALVANDVDLARIAERELNRAGLWLPPEGPLASLTAREQEIASLAAGGMTSRAIAQRLTLSVRTVDSHLARVFAKLGVHSREDLAGVLR